MKKSKREVLESVVKIGTCKDIKCEECPYDSIRCHDRFFKIGAMALLRMFPEKREFDPSRILTCVTADQAKIGMMGYFADNLAEFKAKFDKKDIRTLSKIRNEKHCARFIDKKDCCSWVLFYPIDEVEA